MDIGTLDQRITIQRKNATREADYGTEVLAWVDVATVWAKITDEINIKKGGDESIDQSQRVERSRTQVLIRYLAGLSTDMRVLWPDRARTFQITSMAEKGRRDGIEISVEEYSV